MSAAGGTRAILAALLANLGIALTKFIAFLLTRSSSMLAESVHSVADSGNQVLLLFGGRQARRMATPEHPFGYGRDRYIYAFIVSVVLFTVGGIFALYEGYHKIADPHEVDHWYIAVGVLVVAIGMESFSFRTAVAESNRVRGSESWVAFVRHAKAPELPVVLFEDLGALIGLVFALIGVSVAAKTGNGVWDGVGTIAIGVLLVIIATILAIEMKSLLVGESAALRDRRKIETALAGQPGIERVIHLRTMHLGPEELLVGAKIAVNGSSTAAEIAKTIDEAEASIRAVVPTARVIYLEPDLMKDPPHR